MKQKKTLTIERILKITRLFFVLLLVLGSATLTSSYAEEMSSLITVDGPTDGYSFYSSGDRLYISKPGTYTISNKDINTAVDGYIDIDIRGENKNITLILNGVNLKPSKYAPISCYSNCNLTVYLTDNTVNTLYGKQSYGIAVYNNSLLTIKGKGTLSVRGGVEAKSYNNYYYPGLGPKNITIESGTVYAYGAKYAPGIGERHYCETYTFDGSLECYSYETSNITINGGYVEAIGGEKAAGIGSGDAGTAKNITINGGTIIARGGRYASGIGSGHRGTIDGLTINGGTIISSSNTASGTSQSAAIGGGYVGNVKNITITGGDIIASTSEGYKAIGTYYGTSGQSVILKPQQGKSMLVKTGTAENNILKETSCTNEIKIKDIEISNYVHITTDCLNHTGGTATCKDKAICTVCKKAYGNTAPNNHTGSTEIRNASKPTYDADGYTGDTYCLDCNKPILTGSVIPKLIRSCQHTGAIEIRNAIKPTTKKEGYSGDTYCLECGNMILQGTKLPKLTEMPQTGDTFSPLLWASLLLLASVLLFTSKRNAAKQ